jgi:putative flippase GtrA
MNELINKLLLFFVPAEMAKYVIAGGLAFVADASLLYSLTEYAGWHYLASSTVGFSLGLFVSYLLNIMWVFADRKYEFQIMTELPIFVAIVGSGYLINQLVMWLVVEQIDIDYLLAKVVAAVFVLGFNFVAKKFLLFTKTTGSQKQNNA